MITRHALTHDVFPAAGGRPGAATFTFLARAGSVTAPTYRTSPSHLSYSSQSSPASSFAISRNSSTSLSASSNYCQSFHLSRLSTQISTPHHSTAFHTSPPELAAQPNPDGNARTPSNKKSGVQRWKVLVTYQARPPKADNALMFRKSHEIMENPSHPLSETIKRRWAAFDARSKLHWSVRTIVALNKKPVVRSWVKRRVKAGFVLALRERGWGQNGEVLDFKEAVDGKGEHGDKREDSDGRTGATTTTTGGRDMGGLSGQASATPSGPLVGVLLLALRDNGVVTASWDEIQAACRSALVTMLVQREKQERAFKGISSKTFGVQADNRHSERINARSWRDQSGNFRGQRGKPGPHNEKSPQGGGLLNW